jgi:ribosomal protein S27E
MIEKYPVVKCINCAHHEKLFLTSSVTIVSEIRCKIDGRLVYEPTAMYQDILCSQYKERLEK